MDVQTTHPLGTREGSGPMVPGFRLTVVDGPKAGRVWESSADRCSIGQHPGNDLVLEEPTVSRFHCEVTVGDRGAQVRDLGSMNGVVLDGVKLFDGCPRSGSLIKLGRVTLRFDFKSEANRLLVSDKHEMGTLVGTSVALRSCFALMERAAQ